MGHSNSKGAWPPDKKEPTKQDYIADFFKLVAALTAIGIYGVTFYVIFKYVFKWI